MTVPKLVGSGLTSVVLSSSSLWAQRQSDPDAAVGCAACGTCGFGIIVIVVGLLAINIAILVWVARDAKSRGMDSAVLWMVLVMITGLIGLIIYLLSRPQGALVRCPHCNNNRLLASARCPHCGNA